MPQKPVKLDLQPLDLQPADSKLDLQPLDLQLVGNKSEESMWESLNTPVSDFFSRNARKASDFLTDPRTQLMHETGQGGARDFIASGLAGMRGFGAGAIEGAGSLADQMLLSPLGAVTTALGVGEYGAAKAGLPAIAKLAGYGTKAASVPFALHGAQEMLRPDATLQERGQGLFEAAGGAAGMMHTPGMKVKPEINPAVSDALIEDTLHGKIDTGIPADFFDHMSDTPFTPKPVEPTIEPGLAGLGHDITPDIPQTNETVMGGTSPQFEAPPNRPEYPPRGPLTISSRFNPIQEQPLLERPPEPDINPQLGELPAQQGEKSIPDNFTRQVLGQEEPLFPSEMKVPGKTGPSGLPNIAMGGADERVLDILGTALYTRDRPSTVAKELLQNSVDELKISGNQGPVRIAFNNVAIHPVSSNRTRSVTVKDFGRGMTPDELYTVFSDVGKTGKGNVADASGGFGFAKAAPLLGGDYVRVKSTVLENGKKVQYTFEGSPAQLKKQSIGVELTKTEMSNDTPTGFQVETHFPDNKYLDKAYDLVKETVENSPDLNGIEVFNGHSNSDVQEFLKMGKPRYGDPELLSGKGIPPKVDSIHTEGADVDFHYTLDDKERNRIKVIYLNNGLFALSDNLYAGMHPQPHLPEKIVLNIKANVEEGIEGYPFGANREELNRDLLRKTNEWIKDNIIAKSEDKRLDELQKVFDALQPQHGNKFVVLDSGGKYTPQELMNVNKSPTIQRIGNEMQMMLHELGDLLKDEAQGETVKFGFQISKQEAGGINIPSPKDRGKYAVLVNPFGAAYIASENGVVPNPGRTAQRIVHIIMHEFTHNIARSEGAGYTWALSKVYSKFDLERQVNAKRAILSAITDSTGNFNPEFQKLLHEYTESRGRPESIPDVLSRERESGNITGEGPSRITGGSKPNGTGTSGEPIVVPKEQVTPEFIKQAREKGYTFQGQDELGNFKFKKTTNPSIQPPLEGEVGLHRPTTKGARAQLGPDTNLKKSNPLIEAFNLPRGLMASGDLSAPLRQGIGLIHKPEFWTSLKPMMQAWATEEGFQASQKAISERPLFRNRVGPKGKILPSFATDAGLQLTDLTDLSKREEHVMSTWAEKFPGVRRSNRAYTAFLNNLRADTFESLIKNSKIFGTGGEVNLPLSRELANFVNVATGRGHLGSLEKSAVALNTILFSPRLIAARLTMLNPRYYVMANPIVRMEALKSLFAITAVGNIIGQLGKMAGGEVSADPTSSDFGKLKLGNTRIDPYGGFQQYIVAASRLISGKLTSSTSGNEYDLMNPRGPFDPTHADVLTRFARGKMHPVLGFAWSLLAGQKEMSGQPMNLTTMNPMDNAITQRFIPILMQDVYQLSQQDPKLLPIAGPLAGLGMGIQNYGGQ